MTCPMHESYVTNYSSPTAKIVSIYSKCSSKAKRMDVEWPGAVVHCNGDNCFTHA
jgi:hypothetical protein